MRDSFESPIHGLPSLKKLRPLKEAGGPDWRQKSVVRTITDELSPDVMQFQVPDFGFDDTLNTSTGSMGIWDLLYDNIRQFPKYERLRNIIELKKYQEEGRVLKNAAPNTYNNFKRDLNMMKNKGEINKITGTLGQSVSS